MVNVRIEKKPLFAATGKKTWISGQDNSIFGRFWSEAHESGLVARLKANSSGIACKVTGSDVFGISCVEKDPNDRTFFFYIASEVSESTDTDGLEQYTVPACEWAIFSNRGELPMSLVDAEIYAFTEWLPNSEYLHANAPELEVYPSDDAEAVEFWLPIEKRI